MLDLLVGIMATWRLSALLTFDYGPAEIFLRLRERAGAYDENEDGTPMLGGILGCFWCASIWVGLAVAAALYLTRRARWIVRLALMPFAMSGAAILLSGGGRRIYHMGDE